MPFPVCFACLDLREGRCAHEDFLDGGRLPRAGHRFGNGEVLTRERGP